MANNFGNDGPKNRLSGETSPYLLQHEHNPVDWYPWGADALAAAQEQQKPILLSIGYSACHWCHVMAHESFEDPATAALMNEHFINIKVDREERPDLDKIYQLAHQVLTQNSGGWPLTMFLDPDTRLPFFGGTYFPKTSSYQLPGFADLLLRVSEVFETKREDLTAQGAKVSDLLEALGTVASGDGDNTDAAAHADFTTLADQARDALAEQYDDAGGGFGSAPKFPNTPALTFLLERWAYGRKADRKAFDMSIMTLTKMARGGIYDHLGGGFCRYATDRHWMIPHFEKMLYDNGALLGLYSQALRIGPDQLFEDAVVDTIGWLQREMRHSDGAYFAALDADSEGEEGKYYVWQRNQIKRLLTEDEYLFLETLYGLDKPANFESRWNLHRYDSWRSVAERVMVDTDDPRALWQGAKAKLLAERNTRIPPGLDDKILAGWNGLVIDGLANAGMVLHQPDWILAAQQAMDFVREHMVVDGRLHATWKAGTAAHPAYLDDYAFCLQALVSLLQAQWREVDIAFAKQLANNALELFAGEHGGFYFTANDHEELIHRPMPTMDEATAAGNAVLGCALYDLGHLLGETRYTEAATATLNWAQRFVAHYPPGHCSMLGLAARHTAAQQQVILRGPCGDDWLAACRDGYAPWRRTFVVPYDDVRTLPAYLPRMVSSEVRDQPAAYVCSGLSCSLPIHTLADLQSALK